MSRNSAAVDPFIARIPFVNLATGDFVATIARRAKASFLGWQRRKTIRALERLSDRELRDTGVTRRQIPRLVEDLNSDDSRPATLASAAADASHRSPCLRRYGARHYLPVRIH
ncbi:MAG: DUF1127 domain-containing protein [Pararhodobacter sp.]|nr:DUF1127 domain-containing protein [Pararhodobacter sp.]